MDTVAVIIIFSVPLTHASESRKLDVKSMRAVCFTVDYAFQKLRSVDVFIHEAANSTFRVGLVLAQRNGTSRFLSDSRPCMIVSRERYKRCHNYPVRHGWKCDSSVMVNLLDPWSRSLVPDDIESSPTDSIR